MTADCVVGIQWGDEGKGKIVDLFAEAYDVVVRFQGGSNAGHTVVSNGQKFVLHVIPAGILHRGTLSVIANGVVVDPEALRDEIRELRRRGVTIGKNFAISDRVHVVMPYHKIFDRLGEAAAGKGKIGTTQRGIGPCYADKFARQGIRLGDLYNPPYFRARLAAVVGEKNRILKALYGEPAVDAKKIAAVYLALARELRPFVTDAVTLVNGAIDRGKKVLFEGAQGSLLDIDFGTYPFVTSSNCDACGVAAGAGVPPQKIGRVIGVAKAYCTRVGAGPFPTELPEAQADALRRKGGEFGATTGRPRRCGWFDGVASKFAVELNGVDALAITKLDVLSGMREIKFAVAYTIDGKRTGRLPSRPDLHPKCRPIYKTFPGWSQDITGITQYRKLPAAARRYIEFMEKYLGVPVEWISTGSDRAHTIHRR